jgi:hypothetical protein
MNTKKKPYTYKYRQLPQTAQYGKGGFWSKVGGTAYGILEGTLDTVTGGLTDTLTDKGYEALSKLDGTDNDEEINKFRGAGTMAGAVVGGIVSGNVAGASQQGLKGASQTFTNSKVSNTFSDLSQVAGVASMVTGGIPKKTPAPDQIQSLMPTSIPSPTPSMGLKLPKNLPIPIAYGGPIYRKLGPLNPLAFGGPTDPPPTKKHPLDPNPDGSLPSYFKGSEENPVQLDEFTVTAEAPEWLKYLREYINSNPFNIDEYIENRYNAPIGREAIKKIDGESWRKELRQEGLEKRYNSAMDYVGEQLVKNKPQGKLSRAEWLNTMSDKEEELIKRNPKYQSSLWADTERGLTSLVEQNASQTFQNILNSSDYSIREKQEMLKDYADHPIMSKLGDAAKILSPLQVTSKMVQSAYVDDYSFTDALKGKKNDASPLEELVSIAADPLNLLGVGLVSKLSKANKVIGATKVGSKVLNKTDDVGRGLTQDWYFSSNNQLPPPPSEIQFMPDGATRTVYNQQRIVPTPEGGLFGMTREQTEAARRNMRINGHAPGTPEWNRLNDIIAQNRQGSYLSKPKPVNHSGLTKEEVLQKASAKDKDVVSKMSETEFENTVLKPDGKVVSYKPGTEIEQLTYDLGSRNLKLKDATQMSNKEYADAFNERLDLLNDIIAQRNKSGVQYRVKGLDESGRLTFYTPEQSIRQGYVDVPIPSGESTWGVRLNPGQWRGNVEDIANPEYFRSIPGLEMSNTTSGVFADHIPRRGTGAYDAINEYLKKLDLGRVKPGFNSQTDFSRGAWENFIKSGRGVGFYANPRTVYGTMKTIIPPAAIIGAGAASGERTQTAPIDFSAPTGMSAEQKAFGGEVNSNFKNWYSRYSKATGNSPDPYAKEHYYDYEKFFNDNVNNPSVLFPMDTKDWHLPSQYKKEGHPRTYQNPDGSYSATPISPDSKDTRKMAYGGEINPPKKKDLFSQYYAATGQDMAHLSKVNAYLDQLAEAESFSGLSQSSKKSSAKGFYHYLDDSVKTADQRIKNIQAKNKFDPELVKLLNEQLKLPIEKRSREMQSIMVLSDHMESPTAPYGDFIAGKVDGSELYYRGHHTEDPNAMSSKEKVKENWNNAGIRIKERNTKKANSNNAEIKIEEGSTKKVYDENSLIRPESNHTYLPDRIFSPLTKMAYGGEAKTNNMRFKYAAGGELQSIDTGGSHEQNPMGGVPMGPSASVEEGETVKDDFVFSDRIKVTKDIAREFSLPKSYVGKTYAAASKIGEKHNKHNDHIDAKTNELITDRLTEAQEAWKAVHMPEQNPMMAQGMHQMPDGTMMPDSEMQGQGMPQQGGMPGMPEGMDPAMMEQMMAQGAPPQMMAYGGRIGMAYGERMQYAQGGPTSGPTSNPENKYKGVPVPDYIYNRLLQEGYTDIAAKGILANIKHESNFVVSATEKKPNIYGTRGYGIVQWTDGKTAKRRTMMENWMEENGLDKADLDAQLDYLFYEIDNIPSNMPTGTNMSKEKLNQSTSVEDSTTYFMNNFEAPNAKTARLSQRIEYAKKIDPVVLSTEELQKLQKGFLDFENLPTEFFDENAQRINAPDSGLAPYNTAGPRAQDPNYGWPKINGPDQWGDLGNILKENGVSDEDIQRILNDPTSVTEVTKILDGEYSYSGTKDRAIKSQKITAFIGGARNTQSPSSSLPIPGSNYAPDFTPYQANSRDYEKMASLQPKTITQGTPSSLSQPEFDPIYSKKMEPMNSLGIPNELPEKTLKTNGIPPIPGISEEQRKGFLSGFKPDASMLEYAPVIANTIQGLSKPARLDKNDYTYQSSVTATPYNIEPQQRAARNAYATAQNAGRAASSDAGSYMSSLGNLYGAYTAQNSGLYAEKENQEAQRLMAAQSAADQASQFNSQMGFRVDDWNQNSVDATRNHLMTAADQLGQIGGRESNYDFYRDLYKGQPNVTDDIGETSGKNKRNRALGGYFYKPKNL